MKKLLVVSLIGIALPLSATLVIENDTNKEFVIKGKTIGVTLPKKQANLASTLSLPERFMKNQDTFTAATDGKTYTFKLRTGENEIARITLKEEGGKLIADVSGKAGAEDYEQEGK
jgi:hypothetical protein